MIARTRVTITLPAILHEQAQLVAAERGDSVSDVVRLALQQYLEKTRKEREGLTALYAEFADEDRQLAEARLQAYAVILAEEEASYETQVLLTTAGADLTTHPDVDLMNLVCHPSPRTAFPTWSGSSGRGANSGCWCMWWRLSRVSSIALPPTSARPA